MTSKRDTLISDLIRKAHFMRYTLFPFRPRLVARHMKSRLASLLGIGKGFRIIDLAITYRCNQFCQHCSAAPLAKQAAVLGLDDYRSIVAQADEHLDVLSWNITGGEPLLSDMLEELIPVLRPRDHFISVQSNAVLLTARRARRLARLGVNCITTSIDSSDISEHDGFRGMKGAYAKTLEGLRHARAAGMQVLVGGVVTHQNLRTESLRTLIERVNAMGAIFLFNIATPSGRWKDSEQYLLRGDDRVYLRQLMSRYPMTSTDHEPGRNRIGCPAGMEKIYITAYGDVIPCPFIHIAFGNVRDTALVDIVACMQNVPFFSAYQDLCIAGESREFHRQALKPLHDGRFTAFPVSYRHLFPAGDEHDRDR
ncbi:MAG: radical SAM protein [Deltaproteobacteria bacterium]|nr:radical SAM protein [Deltaproteobacteria bacterium]